MSLFNWAIFYTTKEIEIFIGTACSFTGAATIDLNITYRKVGDTVYHTATGKATLKVET